MSHDIEDTFAYGVPKIALWNYGYIVELQQRLLALETELIEYVHS